MDNLIKTLKTEYIKKKRSGIFSLSFIIGVFLPLTLFIVSFFWRNEKTEIKIPVNLYFEYLKYVLIPFSSFFFPILIIIVSSKIAQIDHKNRGWHLMETQPTTRFSIFFSKFILLLSANTIVIITFLLSSLMFSWLMLKLNVNISSNDILTIPNIDFLKIGIKLFVVSLCITAFQYALSVLIKGFIWPILIGFLSMLLPLMLMKFKNQLFWYPYVLLSNIGSHPKGSDLGNWFTYADALSLLFTVLFLFIGFNWYRFKTFFKAFLHPKTKFIKLTGVVVIIGVFVAITIKPKQQQPYGKTIISGKIESDKEIKKVYVLDLLIKDTIAKIDVVNNLFHHNIERKLTPNHYEIVFENYSKEMIFLGNKDSLNIIYKQYGKERTLIVKGSRIAENNFTIKRNSRYRYYQHQLENNQKIDDADYYMDKIYTAWKEDIFSQKNKRTIDNLVSRNDFLEISRKNNTLRYLQDWNKFKKVRKSFYPNKEYIVSKEIKELENSISKTDYSLLNESKTYFDFVMDDLIKDDKRELSNDVKYFDAIRDLKEGVFKDKLLFLHLKKYLEETQSITKRDSVINLYLDEIMNKSYNALLTKKNYDLNRLSKGIDAPNFIVHDKNNNEFQLTDFKGKFLLVDVWASWCSPCKYESPYFEKKAIEYKNENIQFVSISVDRKKSDWLLAITDKGQTVIQLHCNDITKFADDYNANSIPKFILIDPRGKLIDVKFERPSNKNFDTLLKIALTKE